MVVGRRHVVMEEEEGGGGGRWRRSAGCCDAASSGSRVPEYADIYVLFIELKKEMTANLDL